MFINITTTDSKKLIINTGHIVLLEDARIELTNGTNLVLLEESYKEIYENLFGKESVVSLGASEHTTELLNELHKLCGGRGEAKPTTDRKARLKTRLKDFSEDDLKLAAKNLGTDEFMQGANDNGKRYGTIDYLLRTSANVNKWLEEQPQKKKGMF
jgi:hypothetical protein